MFSIVARLCFDHGSNRLAMEAAAGTLMLQTQVDGGAVISYDSGKLLLFAADMSKAIPDFVEALEAAAEEGFKLRGAFVQPVVGVKAPGEPSDFSERTHETLERILKSTLDHEISTTPKMRSMVELATPELLTLFTISSQRSSPVLVLSPKRVGAIR